MDCAACHLPFPAGVRARAAIAIAVMGDEYVYSYFACDACGFYTVESFHDRFLGDDEITFLPAFPRAAGERCVELVRACPTPYDKNCECPSHRALYYGTPAE